MPRGLAGWAWAESPVGLPAGVSIAPVGTVGLSLMPALPRFSALASVLRRWVVLTCGWRSCCAVARADLPLALVLRRSLVLARC